MSRITQYYRSIHFSHMAAFALAQLIEGLDNFDGERVVETVIWGVGNHDGSGSIIFNQDIPHTHIQEAVDGAGLVPTNHGLQHYL